MTTRPSTARGRTSLDLRLETPRLELRALTLDDLDDVASMLGDAEGLIHCSTGKNPARGSKRTSGDTRATASGAAPSSFVARLNSSATVG
jgi:hypothetical protein